VDKLKAGAKVADVGCGVGFSTLLMAEAFPASRFVGFDFHEPSIEEARRHALDRLVQNATAMGANAVLMMRYDSAEIGNTMSEIVAYGTAAVIEPIP